MRWGLYHKLHVSIKKQCRGLLLHVHGLNSQRDSRLFIFSFCSVLPMMKHSLHVEPIRETSFPDVYTHGAYRSLYNTNVDNAQYPTRIDGD